MKIIIIGCGKVGLTLAEMLSAENHDIVLVDSSFQKLQSIPESLDGLRVPGNGASINTQMEAGVEDADILIAVTGSDELNLLCCLIAKKAGKCHTIARVRNPIYNKELAFIKEKLGLSMIINPELTAAAEISRLLRFPSAIKIDTFAKGRVELLKFRIRPEFGLNDLPIHQISSKTNSDILICGVERGNEIAIPDGNFILKDNDVLSIVASPSNAAAFFKNIGLKTHQVKNTMIVGGGTIAYYTARSLLDMKIDVRIVENNRERCEQLSELLPDATIIYGDGTDKQLLLEEGLSEAESFVTLTNLDEENVLLSLFAKENSKAKLVTKVNKIAFTEIIDNLDIGSVVYPKYLISDYILQYIRAISNSIGSNNVETLYKILDNRAEALEFIIREKSAVTDVPLAELKTKSNLLISCINRHGKIRIPRGQDSIQVGDTVIVVTTQTGLKDIQDILRK
ncbi:MAG TPA: Trk system potassium transporter TrkA [Candidatus Eisenbergiella pullicola]|nr:Trk system potassium transporter TrkA [Candidatus Eisenbergiella pullicola]